MMREHFQREVERLKLVWPQSFSTPRAHLIWCGCADLSDRDFTGVCDRFIGSMKSPPLPEDFISEARRLQKASFDKDLKGACDRIFNWGKQKGLKAYLEKKYPGAETLWDAVTIQRLKLKNGEITAEELLDHGPVDE